MKKIFESINLDIQEVADFIEENGLSFICNDKMQVEASEEDFARLIERFPEIDYVEAEQEPRTLYVLANSVWDADDYLNDRYTDPRYTDLYLFATREEAENKAKNLDTADNIYNDCTIYTGELTDNEIKEITGYDDIADFNEALAEPYSTNPNVKNFGESEKTDVAKAIIENSTDEEIIDCANYDFDKSIEGSILIFWSWERYIGYARKCLELRYADSHDTEKLLTKQDRVFATQCDILLTAEEVKQATNIKEAIREEMGKSSWKWTNPSHIETLIENLSHYYGR